MRPSFHDNKTTLRADFDAIRPVPTRWSDNDMFGHLNNAVYLELFDSVLNAWMQAETGIDENTAILVTATGFEVLGTGVATVADASRALQGALYKDVETTLAAVEKLASSKSLAEAARVHVEFLNQRGQVGLDRVKSATDYLANALQSASKAVQDNIAKMSERTGKAA